VRYLRSFNESLECKKFSDLVLEDIKDILLEIEDIGYYTNAYTLYSSYTFFEIQIDITKDEDSLDIFIDNSDQIDLIDISEIWEPLERILEYSKINGLEESYYDINDVSIKTYILNDINEITQYNLKKLNIFLSFKYI